MKALKNGFDFEVSDAERFHWFWKIFNDGTWEPHTFEIFDKYLKPDRPYFDIGAWIGPTALYGAKKAKQCFAFEPDPGAFMELRANIVRSKIENICAYNVAVGSDWENMDLGKKGSFGDSMSSFIWKDGAIKVPCIPLETIGMEINPNFIKMDIEGGEMMVLPAAQDYLREFKPTLYLSLHTPWFEGVERAKYFAKILEAVFHYPRFYNEKGVMIKAQDIPRLEGFTSIICTYELE